MALLTFLTFVGVILLMIGAAPTATFGEMLALIGLAGALFVLWVRELGRP